MFGGAEGDDAPSDTNNLEGGVSFRFNFAVKGESGGGGGEEVEGKKGEDEEQQQQRLASSSVTTKPSAPAFEVVPDAVDVGSLQVGLRWSFHVKDIRIGSKKKLISAGGTSKSLDFDSLKRSTTTTKKKLQNSQPFPSSTPSTSPCPPAPF
jgi:hypothetical protein